VSFAAIILCVASQRVFASVVYFVMTQSGNFWIHPRRKLMPRPSAVINTVELRKQLTQYSKYLNNKIRT
jgi:hypothetical protein